MNTNPTLSAVLPNYNHGDLIARAVTELLAQNRRPDEIIIVEDGSSDDSLSIIREIAAGAPNSPITVIVNSENRGAVAALSQGLEAARGRYVYFAAADDWVLPGFFDTAVESLEANPDIGLFCGEALLIEPESGRVLGTRPTVRPTQRAAPITPARIRRLLRSSDNWILTGSALFRRDAVVEAGGLDGELGSFADGFLARKIALTKGFYFAPVLVSTWTIYPGSTSRQTVLNPAMAERLRLIAPDKLRADGAFPDWYPTLFERRWRFSTAWLALTERPPSLPTAKSMACVTPLDRIVFAVFERLPSVSLVRFLALIWLWLRLRPISPLAYLRTRLTRGLERRNRSLRHAALISAGKAGASRR